MNDQDYMRRAIELAKKGEGWTNPNPLVGAVIVKNGKIIGEGYHARCGELHAERNAIASLTESAEGAVIYVTLEPCCHYGKTPPCTEAIIEHKIARVVIGSRDPNPRVAGGGVKVLREAGIEVTEDLMREECDRLNPVFFHYIINRTPYVVMKYAMTADGKIATKTGASKWITGEDARREVQYMRGRYMGIMAGIGTVLADDPMLNTRIEGLRSPIRIICDSRLRIPLDSQICQTAKEYLTIVVCAEEQVEKIEKLKELGIEVLCVPHELDMKDTDRENQQMEKTGQRTEGKQMNESSGIDLRKLMAVLGERQIDSILLEGGGTLNDSALRAGIVKEIHAFVAPKIFGGTGSKSPVEGVGVEVPSQSTLLEMQDVRQIGEDLLVSYKVKGVNKRCLQEL